jgi:hypothetical protein
MLSGAGRAGAAATACLSGSSRPPRPLVPAPPAEGAGPQPLARAQPPAVEVTAHARGNENVKVGCKLVV